MKSQPVMNRLEVRVALLLMTLVGGVVGIAYLGMHSTTLRRTTPFHIPSERFNLAKSLATAIRSSTSLVVTSAPCPELGNVIDAWNRWLPFPWTANLTLLSSEEKSCNKLARELGGILSTDATRLRFGEKETARIEQSDFTTPNPWQALSGCVSNADDGTGSRCAPLASLGDSWLDAQLLPRAVLLSKQPSTQVEYRGKSVPKGSNVLLTLKSDIQAEAKRVAECFTGNLPCKGVLPTSMADQPRFAAVAMRTGMLGIAVLEVDSGRILALAGAVSDCTRQNLQLAAEPDIETPSTKSRWPAFRRGNSEACPQMPDSRFHWLMDTHPALWPVAPGSTMKPMAVLAGLVDGAILPAADRRWRQILAESHDQNSPRRLALEHGQTFVRLLREFSFDASADLLRGGVAAQDSFVWRLPLRTVGDLHVPKLSYEAAGIIRANKEAGRNVDGLHGHAKVTDYLAARRIMDTAIGGGDVRIAGALGLADMFRRIELRARGSSVAPATHLAETSENAAATINLDFASPNLAARLTWMLSGVTAVRQHGTAAGACRLAFGECPTDGLPNLWGKTGTADAALAEGSPHLKPGVLPTKVFGAVFSDRSGRRLAIAAVALRSREGRSGALELHSNAAAEATLLMVRHLRSPTPLTHR